MLGAIIGDIVGSRFEWNNYRAKDFTLFTPSCFATDDSFMTIAVAAAILDSRGEAEGLGEAAIRRMQEIGRPRPDCGFGGRFYHWIYEDDPQPYNSFGNGAAMRVSACGFAATSWEEAMELSRRVTEVSHNHPEGLKGAEATALAIFAAREGMTKAELRGLIEAQYYPLDFTLDEIRESYRFNETCQDTVPQALEAFLESVDFEDAIRNAISVGGDSDTLAAITGGLAEAYYGIPRALREQAMTYLDPELCDIVEAFEALYPPKIL